MLIRSLYVGALLTLVVRGAAEGQAIPEPKRFKPKACVASDSVFGSGIDLGRARIISPAASGEAGAILIAETMQPDPAGTEITGATFMLMYQKPFAIDPRLNLQLNVMDTALRAGSGARLKLIVDDSLRWDLGGMKVAAWRGAKAGKVPQGLNTVLTPDESRRLVAATRVRGSLGSTEFEFTPEQLMAARGLMVAAVCGQPR